MKERVRKNWSDKTYEVVGIDKSRLKKDKQHTNQKGYQKVIFGMNYYQLTE